MAVIYMMIVSIALNNEDMRRQQLQTDRGANIALIPPSQCTVGGYCSSLLDSALPLHSSLQKMHQTAIYAADPGEPIVHCVFCTLHYNPLHSCTHDHMCTNQMLSQSYDPLQCMCSALMWRCTVLFSHQTYMETVQIKSSSVASRALLDMLHKGSQCIEVEQLNMMQFTVK